MSKQDNTTNTTRSFGVEFELIQTSRGQAVREDVAAGIRDKGVACEVEGYNHTTRAHWKVVTDASIGYENGELVSPILNGEAGLAEMDKALDAASNVAKVDTRCGFHVHVDVRDLSVAELKRVFKLWLLSEDALDCLIAPSRRGRAQWCASAVTAEHAADMNQQTVEWCRRIDACNTKSELAMVFGGRYRKLNVTNVASRGSIEVRAHQGTLNREKALHWVKLCVALVEAARQYKFVTPRRSKQQGRARLTAVLDLLGVRGETRKFFLKRAKELA